MTDLLAWLVDPSGLTPHGFCLLWQPGLIWAHAGADALIGLTYFVISAGVLNVALQRRGLMFMPLFWLFAAFIAFCGLSHWADVLTLWLPAYGAQAVLKVVTAAVSAVTAVALWRIIPKAIQMPSPEDHSAMVEALASSEERFRLIAENANDMVSLVDQTGARIYVSRAVQQLFGVSAKAFMARPASDFIHPDDHAAVGLLQTELLGGTNKEGGALFRALHPYRGEVWIEANARCLTDPTTGQPRGYVSVLRDVTQRMAIKAELSAKNAALDQLARHFGKAKTIAERANRAKTRFLAGVTHELRTPLNGILGYAQLLRKTDGLTERQMQWVDKMLVAGTHLLEMISGVLDLSEIETNMLELQVAAVDLRALVLACVDMVRPAAELKKLELTLDVARAVPDRIVADPKRLRQILLNLVGNAVKYTPSGTVSVTVTTQGDAGLHIEVADTGPGIKPGSQEMLFRDYERLDAGSVTEAEGSGLGLSLAKKLTELMQGSIGYTDNPAGGSIFWLSIPLTIAEAAQGPAPVSSNPGSNPGRIVPRRILIADDVAMNLEIAAAFVHSAGHLATCVSSGEEAVQAAAAEDFDVILMDVRMPGIDGLEATRRIRLLEGRRGMVPIVALTAQAFTEQIAACRAAGMDSHLGKPFTPESLSAAIEHVLTKDRARAATARAAIDQAGAIAPKFGGEFPILREDILKSVETVLPRPAMVTHLRALAEKTAALQRRLELRDPVAAADLLAAETHALGGSAGMFGFERLVYVARSFEQALSTDPAQAEGLVGSLIATLDDSLAELRLLGEHRAAADAAPPAATGKQPSRHPAELDS